MRLDGRMEAFATDNLRIVINLLQKDRERNINILNFIEAYAIHSYERVGDSLLLRGVSDRPWVFISSNSSTELRQLAHRINREDTYFAAIEDRIARGPSAAVYERDQLVAWAMTQDDGAIGFLHVLDSHRNKGYGYQITLAISKRLTSRGKRPFAYIQKDNTRAIKLVRKLGFIEQKQVHWLQLL